MQSPSLGCGPGPGAPGASRLASGEREQGALGLFPHRQRERKGAPQGTPVAMGPKRRQVWPPPRAASPLRLPNLAPSTYFPEPLTPITSSALGAAIAPNPVPSLRLPEPVRPAFPAAEGGAARDPARPADRTPRGSRAPGAPVGTPPQCAWSPPASRPAPPRAPSLSRHAPGPDSAPRRSARRSAAETRTHGAPPLPLLPPPSLPRRALLPSPLCGKWSPPQAGERAPSPYICGPLRLASLHRPYRPDPPPPPPPMSFRKSFSLFFNVKVISRK